MDALSNNGLEKEVLSIMAKVLYLHHQSLTFQTFFENIANIFL